MSVDVPATDDVNRRVSPEAVASHISREDPDTYSATHEVEGDESLYEIQRTITVSEEVVTIQREWLSDGVRLQMTEEERPKSACIGEDGPALSLLGFVCSEHYAPAPCDQFESLFAAVKHDAL